MKILDESCEKTLGSEFTSYLHEMSALYRMYLESYRKRIRPVVFAELCVNLGEFSYRLSKTDDKLRRVIGKLTAHFSSEIAWVIISTKIIGEYYDGHL